MNGPGLRLCPCTVTDEPQGLEVTGPSPFPNGEGCPKGGVGPASQVNTMHRRTPLLPAILLTVALLGPSQPAARADALTDQLARVATEQTVAQPLTAWKFHQPDVPGGEAGTMTTRPGRGSRPDSPGRARTRRSGFGRATSCRPRSTACARTAPWSRFEAGMDDDGEIYVNGRLRVRSSTGTTGTSTLTEHARPGRGLHPRRARHQRPRHGGLRSARVVYDLLGPVQPAYAQYVQEASFVQQIAPQVPAGQQAQVRQTLQKSEAQVDLAALNARNWDTCRRVTGPCAEDAAGTGANHQAVRRVLRRPRAH